MPHNAHNPTQPIAPKRTGLSHCARSAASMRRRSDFGSANGGIPGNSIKSNSLASITWTPRLSPITRPVSMHKAANNNAANNPKAVLARRHARCGTATVPLLTLQLPAALAA